jgi:hypothetical protein
MEAGYSVWTGVILESTYFQGEQHMHFGFNLLLTLSLDRTIQKQKYGA